VGTISTNNFHARLTRVFPRPIADGDGDGDPLTRLAAFIREYFAVDFVETDDGGKEMVVMTSPEFLVFLLVAVILSGRLGHFIVQTYLSGATDPLLR
jgi:hypothetical protein